MDLSTTYLGLNLKNPIVPSASPLSHTLDGMKRLEDAGASAIVMYSLFEEQIAHESAELNHYLTYGTESFAESLTYFPRDRGIQPRPRGVRRTDRARRRSRSRFRSSAASTASPPAAGPSTRRRSKQAGADALELNVYYISDGRAAYLRRRSRTAISKC